MYKGLDLIDRSNMTEAGLSKWGDIERDTSKFHLAPKFEIEEETIELIYDIMEELIDDDIFIEEDLNDNQDSD